MRAYKVIILNLARMAFLNHGKTWTLLFYVKKSSLTFWQHPFKESLESLLCFSWFKIKQAHCDPSMCLTKSRQRSALSGIGCGLLLWQREHQVNDWKMSLNKHHGTCWHLRHNELVIYISDTSLQMKITFSFENVKERQVKSALWRNITLKKQRV